MSRPALLAAVAILAVSGCATTQLPPISSGHAALEEDEKRIWVRGREEANALDGGGILYRDEALNRYLEGVARKLVPPEVFRVIPFDVKVIRNPHLNAFTFPDGAIYVHTGMLARMDNEAQLAALLAHEMAHATHRHAVREFRTAKNKTALFATMRFTIGSLPAVGEVANLLGSLGTKSAVTGYSRAMETEADTEGFRLLLRAGYDYEEAPKLFRHLKEEIEEEELPEPFFFGTHPRLKERMDNYRRLIEDLGPERRKGVRNADAFLAKTRELLLDNAQLDLKAGRFAPARRVVEKYLALRPKDAKGHQLLGELFRH